jgi:hypothetical protein
MMMVYRWHVFASGANQRGATTFKDIVSVGIAGWVEIQTSLIRFDSRKIVRFDWAISTASDAPH